MLTSMSADASLWYKGLLRCGFLGLAGENLSVHMPGGILQFQYCTRVLTSPTCEACACTSDGPIFRRAYPAEIISPTCERSTSQPGIMERVVQVLGTLLGTSLLSIPVGRARELGLAEGDGWPDDINRMSRAAVTG